MFLRLQIRLSSSDYVRNEKRSASNLMVIARMPEDRSKTFKTFNNFQRPSKPYTPVCVHL
eukprot:13261686-Heterocapsa_arctica.AAC.1